MFDEFYANCSDDLREAIDECLGMFLEMGNMTRMPYSRHLGSGIAEFRPSTNTEQVRFLYFFARGRPKTAVIAVAFKKKTRKTPQKEIRKARSVKDLLNSNPEQFNDLIVFN